MQPLSLIHIPPHEDPALWHQKGSFSEQYHCRRKTSKLQQAIEDCLSQQSHDYNNILTWAARCVGFFGLLTCGEFLTPDDAGFNPKHTSVIGRCGTYQPRG